MVKISEDSNGEIITNNNGESLKVKQVMNYQVSGSVQISNDETLLNKIIGDILNNSGDNENRIRVEADQRLLVSVNDLEREYRDRLSAVSYTHLPVQIRGNESVGDME